MWGWVLGVGGAAAMLQGALAPSGRGGRGWAACLTGWILAGAVAILALHGVGLPGKWAQVGFVLVAGFLGCAVATAGRAAAQRSAAENLRLASLTALAVWLFRPYLTADFFGGVDARSYGYAMTDALQQARAGVFPVFVGQGEFMFDGAIHPIRTAPYHQYLGIVLDWLTARALTPLAVQHLTVVWTALQGVLTCYFCLTRLEPKDRRLAWLMSVFYVSAPAAAGAVYGQEMYMTFMAYAYLPWVIFSNLRLTQGDSFGRWSGLAAALAVVWFCHPPVAAWLSLCTLAWQGGRLVLRDWNFASWSKAVWGLGWFVALTAAYFWSIAEVAPPGNPAGGKAWLWSAIGAALAVTALVRHLATGRWCWFAGAAVASAVVWRYQPAPGRWLAAAVIGAAGLSLLASWRPAARWRERLPETIVILLLVAGMATLRWAPPTLPGGPAWDWVVRLWPQVFRPVSAHAQLPSDIQIGYALLGALALGTIGLFRGPALEKRVLGLAAVLLLALCLPLPGLTRFLLSLVPEPVFTISGDIAWFRYLPTMIALAVFAGFLGLTAWEEKGGLRFRRGVFTILAVAGIAWTLAESEEFVRCGYRNVNTPETIRAFYRPENARQFAYIFAGMPVSPYLTNGVLDYHLESRLLRADDATKEIPTMTSEGATTMTLTTTVDDASPLWLHLSPKLELQPGEHVWLQFEFLNRPYDGILICRGPEGFYREYMLPAAGFFEKSFGVAPERPKAIALWNDSAQMQPVELLFVQSALPADGRPFGDFARVALKPYDPASLPVRTLALVPAYRAETESSGPAYLETPRAYIPGYRATVNGHDVAVEASPNHMAMVKLAPGSSRVEMRYTGTVVFRSLLILSGTSWLVLGLGAWHARRRRVD